MPALNRQKLVFWGLAVLASLTFWLFPHPPMADLPQHAGQIAALRDSLRGDFRWQNLVELHLLTPYLLGYLPGAVLALVSPVQVVLGLLLTGAFLGFIAGCCLLRQKFGGEERLDCLFIPAFFSFAWSWGMLTYLLATPFLLVFLNAAVTYARAPSGGKGGRLALAGIVLFFAHGMTSIFGCLFGGVFLLWQQRHVGRTLRLSWPFFPVAALFLLFVWLSKGDAQLESPLVWGLSVWRLGGLGLIFLRGDLAPFSVSDMIQAGLVCGITVLPFALASFRLRAEPERGVFLLLLLALWMLLPEHFLGTGLIYERLAMFILPFYLLLFAPKPRISGLELKLVLVLPALFCLAFLALHVVRLEKFHQAERDYRDVISQIAVLAEGVHVKKQAFFEDSRLQMKILPDKLP